MVNKKEHTYSGADYRYNLAYRLVKRLIALIIFGSFICIGLLHAGGPCGNMQPSGLNYCISLNIYNSQATLANGMRRELRF